MFFVAAARVRRRGSICVGAERRGSAVVEVVGGEVVRELQVPCREWGCGVVGLRGEGREMWDEVKLVGRSRERVQEGCG